MKNRIILCILLSSIPLVLNAEIVDFDGSSKINSDIKNLLPVYLQEIPITPVRVDGDFSQSICKNMVF